MHVARKPLLAAALLASCLAACGPTDPHERVLAERLRWSVTMPSGWSQSPEDGSITTSLRVSGPASSELDRLTIRFLLEDAEGRSLGQEWYTVDLSRIERGGPEDVQVRLPAREVVVDGIGLDTVPSPTVDDVPRIEELQL